MIIKSDADYIKDRYIERLARYGYSQMAVGWGEKGRQELRYRQIFQGWTSKYPKSCLDLGAGFGDGAKYFKEIGGVKFVGYEFISEFVDIGNKHNSETISSFSLKQADLFELNSYETTDIVVCSGLFNSKLKSGDNLKFIERVLDTSLRACVMGVTFNFLRGDPDYREDYIYYAKVDEVMDIVRSRSRRFLIDMSYLPFEYSVTVLKEDDVDRISSTFKEKSWS